MELKSTIHYPLSTFLQELTYQSASSSNKVSTR